MSKHSHDPGADRIPTGTSGLIRHYEEIASASRSMLEAAHQGDWARVEQIELRCWEMIAALKQAAKTDSLSSAEKKRRMALLRTILDDDAQIRLRAEPWLRDLENFLASARQPAKRTP
jgi:flagellar protein FliT